MKIRYVNEPEDVQVMTRFVGRTVYRKQYWLGFIAWPVGVLLVGLLHALTYRDGTWLAWAIMFAVVNVAMYPFLWRFGLRSTARQAQGTGPHAGVLGEHELEVTPDGLVERTSVNETRLVYESFRPVGRSATHAFLLTTGNLGFVIPRVRVLEGDVDAFLQAFEAAVSAGAASAASPP